MGASYLYLVYFFLPSEEGRKEEKRQNREGRKERERDVGLICVKIYDDLALEAWTQRRRGEERRGEKGEFEREGLVGSLYSKRTLDE